MVAEENVALLGYAEGVLKLSPAGQSVAAEALCHSHWRRRVAPRASNRIHHLPYDPHHAVVAAHVYVAVVNQEVVSYMPKLLEGFLVSIGYGLVVVVAASHYERNPGIVKQQVVQRS